MTTKIIEAFECTCDKCSYVWSSISLPATCANKTCRSPRWNRPPVGSLANPQEDLADFPVEIEKKSAASPEVKKEPYTFTELVEKRLHPERTDEQRKKEIDDLKRILDMSGKKGNESVLPDYPPNLDEYGPIIAI